MRSAPFWRPGCAHRARRAATDGALTTVVSSDRQNRPPSARRPTYRHPAEGKTYQLWLDPAGFVRPAGLIHDDGTAVLTGNPADAGAIGLTLEPAGSAQPTTKPLLLMTFPA